MRFFKIIFILFLISFFGSLYSPLLILINTANKSFHGENALKYENNSFHSKIYFLKNKNNHKIILIGMQHMAPLEYYKNLLTSIENYPNYQILEEGIFNIEETLNKNDEQYTWYPAVDKKELSKMKKFFLASTKFVEQIENFNKQLKNKKNLDLTHKDFNSIEEKFIFAKATSMTFKPKNKLNKSYVKDKQYYSDISDDTLMEFLIVKRNKKLLKYIKENQKNHYILPWGAAHISHFKKELIKDGYFIEETQDIKVYNLGELFLNYSLHAIPSLDLLSK